MSKKLKISEAAKELGVAEATLRRWEAAGKIEVERTPNGHRRYDLKKLQHIKSKREQKKRSTVIYARVSSHDQKGDLERQIAMLESFCASKGWTYKILKDLGSGLDYKKKGLQELIEGICMSEVERLVITHKDRLLRFGAEIVFSICENFGTDVVIINESEEISFEEELAKDVLEIITVFSARLYGSRSRKNKRIMKKLKEAAEEIKGN